ncbi:ABC transporter [candidate division MSBL1 archaeon SCGC-AAA259I09]|uniref:Probable branched-chain amino acid transport ATP-binding protein LivG n=1 Tax=candidate division MSBL1 archaeon SCGC-AAA259I09 TaxID=1698267 RepID=A0A133UUB5_9EURY|nr:ABC transporter [candidate division MSBL1 archaeon SCGC-AAA259I09]
MGLLNLTGVTKRFEGLVAVDNVDMELEKREIKGLIGPNGAGKTTLFNCISGVIPPTDGKIEFQGEDITNKSSDSICKLGIGRTFQIVRPLPEMTVFENVLTGVYFGREDSISEEESHREVLDHLDFVGLKKEKNDLAKNLPLADRRLLEIARALATNPHLLLLDEVVSGLNQTEIKEAVQLIEKIREELNVTILWIEHVMSAIFETVDRVAVLSGGRMISEGTPQKIAQDEKVVDAYLGEEYI